MISKKMFFSFVILIVLAFGFQNYYYSKRADKLQKKIRQLEYDVEDAQSIANQAKNDAEECISAIEDIQQ